MTLITRDKNSYFHSSYHAYTNEPGLVVLLLPAHDEAATIRDVVARAPSSAAGHPVEVLVVDDGSTDGTGELAAHAGALVLRHPSKLGLGAAVRSGLREAVRLGAVAIAFCDADGEYAPEELEKIVAPILAGEADYVVGSRFTGTIRRMRPWRRVGNRLLTRILAILLRVRITDAQSGYRALSRLAAMSAEISHDYNYAQVLTIDLVRKGFRYAEVPISYSFRRHGRSFVRPVTYLRRVLPAVVRAMAAPTTPSADAPSARTGVGASGWSPFRPDVTVMPDGPGTETVGRSTACSGHLC
ncbi:MAG: hypothetical protein KatS3mg008_1447 [Acidimicrobiales bacterium]|nr:MAG: hypothetical protein KatS3mg008_1447 [Acidimicrobiales bacterium]